MNSKVVIGGGSGFLGKRLCRMLKNKGFEPIVIRRNPVQDGSWNHMTWNELYLKGLPDNCKAVVNLAGENVGNPFRRFNDEFKSDLYDSRIETTKQLVKAIQKSDEPPEVFVGGSAIGYYKASTTEKYDESSGGGDFDFMSKMVRDWENAGNDVTKKNVRHVIVRTGLVLGREGGLIHNMYMPFWFGLGGHLGSGKQWTPWIHAEDLVGIITHAIENDNIQGVLNGVAPNCVTNAEFTKAFAKAMRRLAIFPMPEFVINKIFGTERGDMFLNGVHVVPRRTLESGYEFMYPYIEDACTECSRLVADPSLFGESK